MEKSSNTLVVIVLVILGFGFVLYSQLSSRLAMDEAKISTLQQQQGQGGFFSGLFGFATSLFGL